MKVCSSRKLCLSFALFSDLVDFTYYKTTAQIAEVEPRNYTINLLRLSRKETFPQGPAQDDAAQRGHLQGAALPGVQEPQFLCPIGAYLAYDKMP